MITVLSGGVGGSRFIQGLARVVPARDITVIVNTGDDDEFFGLFVSPDIDIVTYALAGLVDEERGWGYRGDTFHWLDAIALLGQETWFHVGDHDLATHIHRTALLHEGHTLSRATQEIASALGIEVRLLPMSDHRVPTVVETPVGRLRFQEYLVKRHAADRVLAVDFVDADRAAPAPGVLDAIQTSEAVIIAPSNPIGSIGPILALPGVREALLASRAAVAAISPVVAGSVFQPPADSMMAGLGHEVSARGVARMYKDLADIFVLDKQDADQADDVAALGLTPLITDTVMSTIEIKEQLARRTLDALASTQSHRRRR